MYVYRKQDRTRIQATNYIYPDASGKSTILDALLLLVQSIGQSWYWYETKFMQCDSYYAGISTGGKAKG